MSVVSRIRQPEYTGENRCIPCTIANSVIAVVLAAAVGFGWSAVVGAGWPVAAAAVLVVSVLSIWLRGYLVPGTPELTKRYFPDWVLARFDKAEPPGAGGFAASEAETERNETGGEANAADDTPGFDGRDVDPETLLLDGGVVEPCEEIDDLCLDDAFREAWRERMATLRDGAAERDELARQLDVDPDAVSFEEHSGGAFTAYLDGARAGQWESRAAMVADLAAGRELPDWIAQWESFPPAVRSQLLGGLRIFLDDCPDCGGAVVAGQETVESCCRSYQVVAASCEECGSRLLEVPYDEEMAA